MPRWSVRRGELTFSRLTDDPALIRRTPISRRSRYRRYVTRHWTITRPNGTTWHVCNEKGDFVGAASATPSPLLDVARKAAAELQPPHQLSGQTTLPSGEILLTLEPE
jgi:hypothetical protein